MPGPNMVLDKGFTATTAIRKFRFVTQTANEAVKEADALGQRAIGVGQEEVSAADATSGRVTNVRMQGVTRVIAGDATPVRGARVASDAQGRAIIVAATQVPLGIVVSAPTTPAAGDQITVELTPGLPAA